MKAKIAEIKRFNLNIEMIAPSHGIIWRDNPMQIVEKYEKCEIIQEGIKFQYNPTGEELKECEAFGENFAKRMQQK